MFKALTIGVLCSAALGLRMDPQAHEALTWSSADNLSDEQKRWDEFFRSEIGALGDSKLKKVSGNNNFQYLDSTSGNNKDENADDNNEIVAWEVNGGKDGDNWIVNKVVQVKTTTDKDDENISYVTKTTYQRNNLPSVATELFA